MATWKPDQKATLPTMQMRVALVCQSCSDIVMSQIVEMNNVQLPRVERDRRGRVVFMGRTITKNVKCPTCCIDVIKVEGRLNLGIHGNVSISSISTKTRKEAEKL